MKKVCTKNLVLQIDRGNLRDCLKTFVLSMLTMEQGNLWSKAAQAHTQWKNNLLLKKIVTLRYSTRTTSSTVQSTRRTLTSTFQECHIQQRNDHMASTFEIWFRRSRTTLQRQALQSDLQQHRQFNPFSKESQDVIKAAGNTELCELLDVEPKALCKACLSYWDVGIVCCTCGHFLRDDMTENKTYIKSVLDLFSILHCYIRKGRSTVTATGRKVIKNITLRINSKRSVRNDNSWAFTIGSSVMHDSERPWSNWVALKKWFARWTNWRTRITHTMLQKKNSMYTVAIGGYVRILLVPTRCP